MDAEPQSERGCSSTKVKCRDDVTTAYVILTPGEPIDVSLLKSLELLQLVVKHCGRGDVDTLCCDGDSIVVDDFSSFIKQRNPSALYYGPLAIKRSVALRRRLPFTGHSMLTTILYGRKCCLNVSREQQPKYRLHIYALGGRLAESIADASFLVTSTAAGKMYDIARKFEIQIVSPKFIDYLWSRRNQLEFEFDERDLKRFQLPVFANLKMSFHGFDETSRYQLEETAIRNGAIVLVSPTATSLVIVDPNLGSCDSDILSKRSLGVEWFHQSLAEGHAKSFTSSDIQCHFIGSLTDKKFLILIELRNSETKYLETIGMIVEMVLEHLGPLDLQSIGPFEQPITKFQRMRIFRDFPRLYDLHRKLLPKIEDVVQTRNVQGILEVFSCNVDAANQSFESAADLEKTSFAEQIVAVYTSYLTNVESVRKYILTLEGENPNFARFVRLVEERPESGREKLVDLLVHPMQRWPRILLLLKRLAEVNSGETTPLEVEESGDAIRQTYDVVQRIVRQLDEAKAARTALLETLDILSQIEEMPPVSWSEHYALRLSLDLNVKAFLNDDDVSNVPANCFVFSHALEIARKKKTSADKPESQPFKHVKFIRFSCVQMFFIESILDANHVEVCFRQDDFSQEQVLLECDTCQARDELMSQLRQLCPKSIEVYEIFDVEQKMRCESLLLQWCQSRKDSNVTKALFRNLLGNVNKLF